MIKLSSGTASVIGLSKVKLKTPPTTGYLMLGDTCSNNCKFCTQSASSHSSKSMLSRVDWHKFEDDEVLTLTNNAYIQNKIKRLCLQVVENVNSLQDTIQTLQKFKNASNVPICASSTVKNIDDANSLFDAGLDRLCVALDAATEEIYNRVKVNNVSTSNVAINITTDNNVLDNNLTPNNLTSKQLHGNDFNNKLNLLTSLSKHFPGKITTHLIVGLGESEWDMANIISFLSANDIQIGLFAFTPVKGTHMEHHPKPSIESYRRIQIINYLFQTKSIELENISQQNGIITILIKSNSTVDKNYLHSVILNSNGIAFMTSGCPDCNRPYYNESPGSIPYNYPYTPNETEISLAIKESGLF